MKGYHEGKKLNKVMMSTVSILLCIMMVAMSTMTAFAGTAVDATDGNIFVFNSVDDIANDEICLIVFGDMYQAGADSQGRALIGGNLTIDGGWSASVKDAHVDSYVLGVGGSLYGSVNSGGCVAVAGDKSSAYVNGDNYCYHNGEPHVNDYVHDDTSGWVKAYVSAAEATFKAASKQYAQMPANGTSERNQWYTPEIVLTAASNHVSGEPHVFYIDGTQYIQQIKFVGNFGDDAIIINVSGTKPADINGGQWAMFQDCDLTTSDLQDQAIWNFYEATSLYSVSFSFEGSLLAPYATYSGNNGHVNGTTVVKNMNGTGGFEYHTGHFLRNPLKAGLTVTKSMSDGSTPNEKFGFELFRYNRNSWVSVETFSLKAGETKTFSNLVEGQTYKVKETNSGSSKLIAINGNANANISDCSASFTVNSVSYNMNFVNEAATGSITVSKKLVDSINPNAKFSFTLQKYENGSWQNVAGATNFTLGNGDSRTFTGLAYGTYRVVEDADTSIYDVSISGDGSSVSSAESSQPAASVKITDTSLTPKDSSFAELTKGFRTLSSDAVIDYIYVSSDGVYSFCLDFNKWSPAGTGTQYALNKNFNQQYVGVMQGTHAFKVSEARILVANFLYPTIDHEYPNVGEVTKYHVAEWMLWGNLASAYTGFSNEAQQYANWLYSTPSLGIVVEPSDNFTLGGYANNGTTQSVNVTLKENVSNVDAVKFNNLPNDAVIYDANGKAVTLKTSATGTKYFRNPTTDTYKIVLPASYNSSAFSNIYVGLDVYSNRANEYVVYTATEYTDSFQPMLVTSKILSGKWKAITVTNGITENNPEVVLSSAMQNAELTFTNTRKNAVLTVSKTIKSGDPATDESFTFQLYSSYDGVNYQKSGNTFTLKANTSTQLTLPAGVYYKVEEVSTGTGYSLDSSSNTNIFLKGDTTATFTNALTRDGSITVYKKVENGGNSTDKFTFKISGPDINQTFTLTAGQSQTFTGLRPGDVYTITETGMDSKYEFVSVEGGQANGKSVAVTVSKGATATFTNKVKTGSITVTKTLTDTINPNAVFNFVVKDAAGNQVGTLSVGNGQSATLNNLPYGGVYTVTESVDSNTYVTTYSVDGASAVKGATTGSITISGNHKVAYTNTRASATLTVTKALQSGAVNLGESFTFQLYKKVNGSWTAQGSSFKLSAGASKNITVDVGAEYAVVETSTGNSYDFSTVSGGTSTVSIGGAYGASFVATKNMTITVTNKLKTGSIYVYKKLNDSIFTDASFTFTLQKKVGSNWTDVEMISIKNNQGYQFRNLEYGYQYRVVENVDAAAYTTSYVVNNATVKNGQLTTGTTITSGVASTTNGFTLDAAAKSVTFTNTRKTASLTINKALTDGSNNMGESFTFSVERYVNGAWESTGKTVTILAGASETVSGLEVGVMYRITETSTGKSYTYTGISGVDENSANGGVLTLNSNAAVTVTNSIKTGKIVISKTVNDSTDPNAKFTFTVYQKINNQWTQYGQSFTLGNGETKEITGLPYGSIYKVVEYNNSNYSTSYAIAGSTVNSNETGEITITGDAASVAFTNTRKSAAITISKALTAGSANIEGEVFKFVLQRQNGSKWTDVETFELNNGGSKRFDLAVGATYRVLEISTGASYRFDSVTGGTYTAAKYNNASVYGASFNVTGAGSITIYNAPKSAEITIRKSVVGTDYNDTFSFEVQKFNGTSYEAVQTFTLKAGGYKTISVLLGESYRIVEKNLDAKYELTSVNGADTFTLASCSADVKVDGSEDITFVNTVKKGSVAVTKTLNDTLDTNASFVFEAYKQSGDNWSYIGSKSLKNGQTWNITGIEYGAVIRIVETDASSERYVTVNTAGGTNEAVITVDGDETVGFTNTRKTASLTVSKKLAEGTNNIGGTFTFELMVETENGWASVTGFTLKAGESKTINGLYADATYMVIEKFTSASKYELYAFTGGTKAVYNGNDAVKFTAVADQTVSVVATNKNAMTTLTIDKAVTGENNNEAFEFVLEKKVNGEYTKVETFSLAGGHSKTFNVAYGDEYRITESNTGVNYKLSSITGADSTSGSVATLKINNADEKVTYTNERKSASITVKKTLAEGSKDLGGEFTFHIYVEDAELTWREIDTIKLSIGGKQTISDLVAGKRYLVTEENTSDLYRLNSVSGGTSASFEGFEGCTVIAAPDTANNVVFANENASTSLTVKKSVSGEYDGQGFIFLLERKEGDSYVAVEEFTLSKDGVKTFEVRYGEEYRVTETQTGSNYKLTNISGADSTENAVAAVVINNSNRTVTFTNTRAKASLNVTKTLAAGSNDLGETFSITVYDENGKSVGTAKLAAGETVEFTDLLAGGTYTVVEEQKANSSYSFLSVSGKGVSAAAFNGNSAAGEIKLAAGSNNAMTFTNKIKGASLTLNKVIEVGDAKNDTFTFEVKINGKAQTVTVKPGTPVNIDVNIGDTVVITETDIPERFEVCDIIIDGQSAGTNNTLTIGKDGNVVTFVNTLKEASLTVTKKLAEGSKALDGTFEFKFDVYHVVDGVPTKLEDKSFTLDGIGKSFTVTGLLAGETYMVVETETGKGYVCAENNKTIQVAAGKNSLDIENKNDKTTIIVEKQVDGVYRGEKFEFSYENKTTGEVGSFTLGGDEWIKVIDVHYGDTVVINETDDGEYFELKGIEGTKNVDGTQATVEVTVNGQKIIYTDTNTTASINIYKKLAEGSTDIGGEFEFEVWHIEGETETLVKSGITLGIGEHETVTGLISGESYKVVETKTGEGWVCVANNKVIKAEPDAANDVVIENKNDTASVKLRKLVDSKYEPLDTDEFEFTVTINGEQLEENVILHAGEEKVINCNYGDVVVFEEVKVNGRYVLADIAGADSVSGAVATVKVNDGSEVVTYTNAIKTGSIIVHKNIVENVPSGKTFTFTLQRANDEGVYVDTGLSLELGNGEVKSFNNLEYGNYKVVETVDSDYSVSYKDSVDGDPTDNNAATIKVNGNDRDIYFVNTRREIVVTIAKELADGKNTDQEFKFVLQQLDGDTWTDLRTITIKGEGVSEAIKVEVNGTYRVLETFTGSDYVYSYAKAEADLNGVTDTEDGVGSGIRFVPTGSGKITFTNELKQATFEVKKVLESGNATDSFTFYYTINDGAMVEKTVQADKSFTFNVKYNDVVKVYEKSDENYTLVNINAGSEDIDESKWIVSGSDLTGVSCVVGESGNTAIFTNTINRGALTVTKTVRDSYTETSGVFSFKVQKHNGTGWDDITEIFTLSNGESKTINDIDYGTQVRVVEIIDNEEYYTAYYTVNGGSETEAKTSDGSAVTGGLTISGSNTVEFINVRNTAKLSITKKVEGANLGDTFKVVVETKNASGVWAAYETVELTAGAEKTIDIGVGVEYRVRETDSGKNYTFVSINDSTSGEYLITVNEAGKTGAVTVNNKIKTGTLTVSKTLNDVVDPDATFSFTVVDEQGNIVKTFELKNGGQQTIANLPYGSVYTVIEAVNAGTYSTSYSVDAKAAAAGVNKNDTVSSSDVAIFGDHTVEFINTRKTAELEVTKTIKSGDEDLGETFSFVLQRKDGSKWVDVETFNLQADETYTAKDLYVNAEYRVLETNSGKYYVLDSVNGGDLTSDTVRVNDANVTCDGVRFTVAPGGSKVEIVNTELRGGIMVTKQIGEGTGNTTDKFTFTITGHGIDETFTLAAGESKKFENLVAGYEYTITETSMDGKYEFAAVAGDGTANKDNQCITVKVPEGEELAKVVFTNNVKTGSLTVSKTLVDAAASENTQFTFEVVDENNKTVDTAIIKAGESYTFDNLFYGKTYTVKELGVDGAAYSTKVVVNGKAVNGTSADVTIAQDANTAEFTNTRNESTLTLTKTVNGFMADNEEFYITVEGIFEDGEKTISYVVTKDGKPVEGSSYSDQNVIYIAVDEEVVVPGTLYGQDYTVTELGSVYYTVVVEAGGTREETTSRVIEVKDKASVIVENIRKTANLTVKKSLVDNDKDYADTFSFELQLWSGSAWQTVETFQLTVGDTMEKTLANLTCGRKYRVVETSTGENYMFAGIECATEYSAIDTENAAIEFTMDSNKTVTFKNRPDTQGLVVKKQLSGEGKTGEVFTFSLYSGSQLIENFTLEGGESKAFYDLPIGETYKVIESGSGDAYSLTAVNVSNGTFDELKINDELIGVQNLKLGNGTATEVTFTNTAVMKKLTVQKSISGTDYGESYTFQLWRGNECIDTFVLANGEVKSFDVYYGVEYKVVELQTSSIYKLCNVTGADNFVLSDGTAYVTVNDNENLEFTNTPKTGDIVLTKTVSGFAPAGETFEFTVKYDDGSLVKAAGLSNGKVNLKDGETVIIGGIEYGKTVIISEKVNDTYYTTSYTIDGTTGSGTVTDKIAINSETVRVDYVNKFEEPVVLNAYSNGDYNSSTSNSGGNNTTVIDETPVNTQNESPEPNNTIPTQAPTQAPPQVSNDYSDSRLNGNVLGASEINTVNTYTLNSEDTPDGDQVITKVLGDSDTPDTGDSVPISVVIALAVSTVMVLTLGKKKKSTKF